MVRWAVEEEINLLYNAAERISASFLTHSRLHSKRLERRAKLGV